MHHEAYVPGTLVIDQHRYIKAGKYGTGDGVYACDCTKDGNCTEFHSLLFLWPDRQEYHARLLVGASIRSDRDEGGIDGYHCWQNFSAEGQWGCKDIRKPIIHGSRYLLIWPSIRKSNRIHRGRDLKIEPGHIWANQFSWAYPVMEIG